MKNTYSLFLLVSTIGFSSLFAQAPDSLIGQNISLTYTSSDSNYTGHENFYLGEDIRWSRDTYNGEWNDDIFNWEKTSTTGGNLSFFWNDYERVDLVVNFSSSTEATFTYTSYELNDEDELVVDGIGSGTISLVDESYEPPFNNYFVEDFASNNQLDNKFFRAPGDTFSGLTINQEFGLYSISGTRDFDPDDPIPNQRRIEIAANSVLKFSDSWVIGGIPFFNGPIEVPNGEQYSLDVGSYLRLEKTGDDGELHVQLFYYPVSGHNSVKASIHFEPKVGSTAERTEIWSTADISEEFPEVRFVNDSTSSELSLQFMSEGLWKNLIILDISTGLYQTYSDLDYHNSSNGSPSQISGWNSLTSSHAYPMMKFKLPVLGIDSNVHNSTNTHLPLSVNQIGFSQYYVKEGVVSSQTGFSPLYLSGFVLNSQDSDWGIYDENLTFSSDSGIFSGSIMNSDGLISFADQQYDYRKTGPNTGGLNYTVNGFTFRHLLSFDSENTGTYTKFADYGQGDRDVTYGEFSLSGDGADSLIVDVIDGGRDSVYLQTSNGPEFIEGAGEFGFDIFLPNEPELSAAELELNGQSYNLTQDDAPSGFRTRYGYGRGEIHELYDIESYSDTDLSSFSDGAEFIFSLSHNGNDYSYTHNIVAESDLPAAPNLSINGDANWTTDSSEGHEYLKLAPADYVVVSWDSFQADDVYDHINISLQKWVGEDDEDDVFDDEDLVVSATSTSYEFSGILLEPGQKYTFYVEFVDVTEVSNPEGFRRASQTYDEPILFTYASSITALDMEIVGDSSGALDGIVIYVESEDPVKETLIFENGALTSIFDEDNGQNIHKNEGLSYQYYEINDDQFSITMEGGEHYIFYENNGTGRLLDYSNNGELDVSGTWNFTFSIHEWEDYDDFSGGSLASDKWETGYWDGAQAPEVIDGKARLSSNGSGVGSQVPSFMDDLVGMPDNGTNHSFLTLSDSSVIGVEAEISLSSTSSIETGLYLGIMEELDSGPGFAFAGIELGYWDQSGPSITFDNSVYVNGEETVDEVLQEKPANLGQSYKVSVLKGDSTYQLFLDDELVQEYPIRGELLFFHFGAFQEPSVSFDTFVDNVRVLRHSDSDLDDFEDIYVSGGSQTAPYYNFSNEEGPIDLSSYEFGAGQDYRFIAVEGFTPHTFAIGSAPSTSSSYVSGGPLGAVGDELTLSIPSDFDTSAESLAFYCVAHPTTMNGELRVLEKEFEDIIDIPVEQVVSFVDAVKSSTSELADSDPVWANKILDVIDEDRFAYEVGLNNMINLYFDQNGGYLHAAEDYSENRLFIPNSEITQSAKDLIASELAGSKIIDFESERSAIEVPNNSNEIFIAIVENNESEMFEVVINGDGDTVIVITPFDDYIPWRPVELPEVAVQYLADNYVYEDGYPMNYWEDQRPTPDGQSMEFVAYLEDGREVIFNENGSFNREFNPWDIEEDAKLSFNPKRSAWGNDLSSSNFSENTTGGDDPAYVHIEKLNLSSSHNGSEGVEEHTGADNWDDMIYRISLVNTVLGEDANLTRSDLELGSTLLPAGTPLKLTFTYETGEPRYILLSGGKVRGFKRTWPEWDRPGTITVLAETVDPVATSGTDLSSTFGMIVVMGGERWYNGAIFQANVPVLDMMPSEMISPYEQVAGFSLVSETSADANISAFLPRDLLEWNFGISEPHRVKAGLMDENGSLLFINGSGADEEGAEFTGGGFTRVIHKGHEPDFAPYPQEGGDDDYKLGDEDSDEGFIDSDEQSEEGEVKSKFDFNADGYGDSLLEIRFHAGAFPSDIGFGDPYEDPYKDLNKENMGSISGNVLSDNGAVIPDVGLWFFQAPDGLDGPWEPAFFILDINHSSGFYEAYLPTGVYYVEAWGFDPTTNTPYKSEVSSQSFSVIDANSSFSYDISLEADFVVSHEFGQISSRLNISGHEEGHPLDISFELYPVDQNGTRLTDYPTGWLWVEPDGKIQGEAPAGRYEVVLFSYDNSVRLSGGTVHWDVVANQLNEFSLIEAAKSQPLAISGMVRDADTNNGIWAEVIFVDPNDEFREFWPSWEHDESESFIEGSYSVKIPAGTYKIKAMRWDGLYQSEFYTADGVGTTDFSAAAEVVINANKTDIDFNLNGSPAAQVAVRIVDANTSSAVEFAWFAFFDAEDEYGPVVYPHVQETEGNYSLKLPGGSYKLMAEAGGYEPKYLVTNADGSYTWTSGDWSSAASLVLTDSNTTSLPLVELNAFAQEDHERYDFDWFDGDANITFGTISGTVVTNKGNAVPKARIVAHTDDYLFWFDHFETKIDGSYELSNLPSGNWIVIAEPPFESEEYLGYRSSQANWESPISVDANTTSNIKLTLQGSNVSGRIMYPKKDENGRVKLTALADAFLWAFQDENQTGEPNYEYVEGEDFIFNEAYGETNSDGFFSLSLPEAGKYSIRIEVPGNLANLALAPIHFELKNPSKEMRLGNAIRVDWSKSDARASTYKLERKASTESVYTSVDANISGTLKSYIDSTATPGVSYEYKVTATTATGTQALATTAYKVSKPFIYLVPPNKTITGKVRDDLNASISGAEVVAVNMNGEGWANTFSDNLGDYELSVGPGKWEVTVYRPWDENVNWSYDKAPKMANFAESANKTIKTLNFTVNRMGDGKVVGTIAIPNGMTDVASSIWIDVFTPDGIGNWANPESNGSFSIPLKPGQYEFSVWLDPEKFKGYGSPEPQFIRVGKTEVDVGTIVLAEFNSTISGVIATSSGSPLGNAEVWAWSETGGWTSDVTDTTGAFELKVAPGRWEVGFNPPIPADGSESPYLLEPPKRIKVGDGVKTLNFTVRKAASKVEGVVYGPSGAPVADLNAWAYAREAGDGNNSDEFLNVLAEVALSPRGTFSFPGLPGTYTVGLWMPPGSDYAQPGEQTLTLSDTGVLTDGNGTSMNKIEFTLAKVDSYVAGSLIDKDTNQSISGLVGEVYAMRTDGDGWQYASIETNGTYSMLLPPGNWVVEYYLEYDDQNRNYPKASAQPLEVIVQQGATVEGNFVISAAGASISGSVVYDSNSSTVSESTLYVWAYREGSPSLPEYWDEVETDDNGSFTISVLQGGKYEVGVILSNDLREEGYLEPAMQKFKMSTSTKTGLEFRLAQPAQDNYLSGTVVDGSGNSLAGAFVYAWTYDGRESSVYADNNGDFNMTVPSGALWKLGAEFSEFDANDTEILYFAENDVEADLRKNEYVSGISIVLARPEFEVPDGISITFDPSKDFVTTLPDGTEITIPGGAANVSSDVKTIRLVVTPTAKGLDKSGTDKPADYAYSMELFDDKGKEIEGNFKKDVVIRIPVDVDSFRNKGIDLDTLEGMYYSPTKKAWAKAKTSTFDQQSGKLTMTTDHFTVNSLVGQTAQSDLVADTNTSSLTGYDNWYQSDWLGSFFDASADKPDWVFHVEEKLGWMWVKTDAAGNYWFNHTTRGWLWTGADYFIEGDDTKSHFYSFSLGRWLYFHPQNGFYDYEANGGSYLD